MHLQEVEIKAKLRSEREKRKAPSSAQAATGAGSSAAGAAEQSPQKDGATDAQAAADAAPASMAEEGASQAAAAEAKSADLEPKVLTCSPLYLSWRCHHGVRLDAWLHENVVERRPCSAGNDCTGSDGVALRVHRRDDGLQHLPHAADAVAGRHRPAHQLDGEGLGPAGAACMCCSDFRT